MTVRERLEFRMPALSQDLVTSFRRDGTIVADDAIVYSSPTLDENRMTL